MSGHGSDGSRRSRRCAVTLARQLQPKELSAPISAGMYRTDCRSVRRQPHAAFAERCRVKCHRAPADDALLPGSAGGAARSGNRHNARFFTDSTDTPLPEAPMPFAQTNVRGHIGVITLDYPAKRNALSKALVDEIMQALADFRARRLRTVVLRAAAGAKVWSAGHDVDELPASRRDPLGWDDPLRYLIREIETSPAPVIAMIEGTVWGGACETVFACDLIIATPEATFALTPARLGVPYNIAGVLTFLNAGNLRIGKEMAFTAKPITAERAEQLGMINYVVPSAELESFTFDLAGTICENAPLSIAVMKEQMRILAGAHPMSPQGFERVQGLRRLVYDSDDYQEGIRAFKERRKPVFRGE
jgi:methylmalonyl-CoA decarboxylase